MDHVNRSPLYVPITNPKFVEGAWGRNSDGIILDLEDAVEEVQKHRARSLAREAYDLVGRGGATIEVRINHDYWAADLDAVVWPRLSAIGYPKTESADEVRRVDARISDLEQLRGIRAGTIELHPYVETVRGVVNCRQIAGASPRIRSFGGGGMGVDMARDLAVEAIASDTRTLGEYSRGECQLAGRALGLRPGGGVSVGPGVVGDVVSGSTAFDEAAANRRAGFHTSIVCLHPNRIEPANRGFTPPPNEVEEARRVLAQFEELDYQGEVRGLLNGNVVDRWEAARAVRVIQWADACARKERAKAAARARTAATGQVLKPGEQR